MQRQTFKSDLDAKKQFVVEAELLTLVYIWQTLIAFHFNYSSCAFSRAITSCTLKTHWPAVETEECTKLLPD